ncbi:MAG: hypothetical protein U0572_07565 [Phycisphaerales bacterium]
MSAVDTAALADRFAVEIDNVEGLSCLPVNRTLAALHAAGLPAVHTEAEAQQIIRLLGVDALMVGTVTAWDPYRPFQLGVAVQLVQAQTTRVAAADVNELTLATGDQKSAATQPADDGPLQVSKVYDANNHDTLTKLADYAAGRNVIKSGLRANVYTSSMDSYSRFCAYDTVRSLLEIEAARLGPRAEVVVAPTK